MDANFSTMTMPKTMPVQNLLRYMSFKSASEQPSCQEASQYHKVVSVIDPDRNSPNTF